MADFGFNGFGGFGLMFTFVPIIMLIIFLLMIGTFIFAIVRGLKRNNSNNHSPVLTVEATVVSKRNEVTHHHNNVNNDTMNDMSSSTLYYVTFQVESGDRLELALTGSDFGMLVEGDVGRLTFQGTRYKGFERKY